MPARKGGGWIDATIEFGHPAATWPGDAPFEIEWTARLGDAGPLGVNLSCLRSSPHNGTHADAPYHVLNDGGKSETLPLEAFVGPAIVLNATGLQGDVVPASMAERALRHRPERVLVKTRQSVPRRFGQHVGFHPDFAQRLVDAGVQLIGTDAPSVDRADLFGLSVHRTIFTNGAYNLESLDLSRIPAGRYELHAPPLKVTGLCAAPARALLRRLRAA